MLFAIVPLNGAQKQNPFMALLDGTNFTSLEAGPEFFNHEGFNIVLLQRIKSLIQATVAVHLKFTIFEVDCVMSRMLYFYTSFALSHCMMSWDQTLETSWDTTTAGSALRENLRVEFREKLTKFSEANTISLIIH